MQHLNATLHSFNEDVSINTSMRLVDLFETSTDVSVKPRISELDLPFAESRWPPRLFIEYYNRGLDDARTTVEIEDQSGYAIEIPTLKVTRSKIRRVLRFVKTTPEEQEMYEAIKYYWKLTDADVDAYLNASGKRRALGVAHFVRGLLASGINDTKTIQSELKAFCANEGFKMPDDIYPVISQARTKLNIKAPKRSNPVDPELARRIIAAHIETGHTASSIAKRLDIPDLKTVQRVIDWYVRKERLKAQKAAANSNQSYSGDEAQFG